MVLSRSSVAWMRRQTPAAHFHVETSHFQMEMTFRKYFGINGCSDTRFFHMEISRLHLALIRSDVT